MFGRNWRKDSRECTTKKENQISSSEINMTQIGSSAMISKSMDEIKNANPNLVVQVDSKYIFSDSSLPSCLAPRHSAEAEEKRDSGDRRDGGGQKKKQGMNKKRPRDERQDRSNMLCKSVVRGEVCPFDNGKCKFSHDLKKFYDERPKDLGDRCYSFDTYGFCTFGVSCRWGKVRC